MHEKSGRIFILSLEVYKTVKISDIACGRLQQVIYLLQLHIDTRVFSTAYFMSFDSSGACPFSEYVPYGSCVCTTHMEDAETKWFEGGCSVLCETTCDIHSVQSQILLHHV